MHSRFCGELLVFRAQREKGNIYVSLKSIYGSSRKEGIQSQTHMPQKSIGALADVLQEGGLALAILPASKSMGCKWGPQATQRTVANLKSKLPGHFALLWSELPASHCCQAKKKYKTSQHMAYVFSAAVLGLCLTRASLPQRLRNHKFFQ